LNYSSTHKYNIFSNIVAINLFLINSMRRTTVRLYEIIHQTSGITSITNYAL